MNKNKLDTLIINFVKDKLSLNILNNICEIFQYSEEDSYEDIEDNIKVIRNKLPNYFYNIKNVISEEFDKRDNFIDEITKDIKEIEKLSLPIIATLKFCDLLKCIIDDYYEIELIKKEDSFKFNNDILLNKIYDFLDSEKDIKIVGATLMSLLKCNMLRDNYKEYINKSLNILFREANEEIVESTINTFKIKFAPFKYVDENDDTKNLLNILNKKYSNIEEDELLKILEIIDNIAKKYSNKIGNIGAIYGCYMEILSIYKFTIDKDYIFDDFIIKDMYYYTCEMIESNDFSTYENIQEKIDTKYEELFKRLDVNQKIINKQIYKLNTNEYSDVIKIYLFLENNFNVNLERNILFNFTYNNNLASQNFIDEKIDDFLNFINNLDINNIMLKRLKQNFFSSIPCPLDKKSLKLHIKTVIDGLKIEETMLFALKNLTLLTEEDSEDDFDFNDDDCCDEYCSHNH